MSVLPVASIPFVLPSRSDREGFDRLFKKWYPRLIAYAELMLDSESAEDVVQDLMVYIWEHCDSLKFHTSFEAYLFRSLYRKCLNKISHDKVVKDYQNRSAVLYREEENYYDPESHPIILKLFTTDLSDEIEAAIAGLPEKCRLAFTGRYIEGRKTREIAEMLNITERTAETHIYHALKQLKETLKDKFILFPFYFF